MSINEGTRGKLLNNNGVGFYLWFIFLMFCIQNKIYGVTSPNCIVISMGHTCATANMIKHFGLRHRSYPFDWLISDLDGIINAFNNDFAHFIDEAYFEDIGRCNSTIEPIPGRMGHSLYN